LILFLQTISTNTEIVLDSKTDFYFVTSIIIKIDGGLSSHMGYAETFKALDDPIRREILLMLKNGQMSAGEICERLNVTAGNVSHHLSQLKNANLIKQKKYKNFIFYELSTSLFEDALTWLFQFKLEIANIPLIEIDARIKKNKESDKGEQIDE